VDGADEEDGDETERVMKLCVDAGARKVRKR
jgi:hypothetical protein